MINAPIVAGIVILICVLMIASYPVFLRLEKRRLLRIQGKLLKERARLERELVEQEREETD